MMTPEMQTWLAHNSDGYEVYLLHGLFNDPGRRTSMLSVIEPDDMGKEEHRLLLMALKLAVKISNTTGEPLAYPPERRWMKSCVTTVGKSDGADKEVMTGAKAMLETLEDPSFSEQWVHINPFFEAWLTSSRAKRYARKAQRDQVADAGELVGKLQKDIAAARAVTVSDEDDEMTMVTGDDGPEDTPIRRRTGITGLDEALCGGWGVGECYLLFGGTSAGKSLAAGQCAWYEAFNDGWPLVVSTELYAREYVARTVSNACSIRINLLQDCQNYAQIRRVVAMQPGLQFKLAQVEKVLATIKARMRIAKVSTDAGMDAKGLLYREMEKYKRLYGRYPTWVCLDWLGSMADLTPSKDTSERAMAWESSANGCVQFADETGIPTLVLAQAVNDAQLKAILTIHDIGIAKGIGKNMIAAIGVTNAIDKAGIAAAVSGKSEMPRAMIKDEQFFCMAKARKSEGTNIPVQREFLYQRFVERNKK